MRCGIFASARYTAPGGVTATVPEVVPGAISGSGATDNFSITTSLVSSDVVIVVVGLRRSTDTVTVSGLGGVSWTQDFSNTNTGARGLRVFRASGAVGSGTVSITHSGTATMRAVVYVLRGLNSTTLAGVQSSAFDSTSSASESSPSQSFGLNQVAIFAAMSSSTIATFTLPTGSTPSSWTVDDNTAGGNPPIAAMHIVGAASGSVVGGVTANASTSLDCVCLVYGTAG